MLFLSDLKEGKPKITNGGQAKKSNGATPVDVFMWQRRKMSPFNGYGGWQWPASRHPPAALTTTPQQDRWRWWGHLSYCFCLPSNTQGKDLLSWKWLNICLLKWGSEWIAYLALLANGWHFAELNFLYFDSHVGFSLLLSSQSSPPFFCGEQNPASRWVGAEEPAGINAPHGSAQISEETASPVMFWCLIFFSLPFIHCFFVFFFLIFVSLQTWGLENTAPLV